MPGRDLFVGRTGKIHGSETDRHDASGQPGAGDAGGAVGASDLHRRLKRWGRAVIALWLVILLFKLGFVAGPDHSLPKWKPWTWRLGPIFSNTLTTGGDTGAHVWTSTFIRRNFLGQLRPLGWSKDWYAGFPVLQFYFPFPTWVMVALSAVIPLNIAFKLVTVAGLVTMPFSAMYFAKAARLPMVYRYLFALSAFLFLFSSNFEILGGNIVSTMAGEFSFAISLSFGLLFLGLLIRVWRDGERIGRAALVLACMGLSHLLPTLFVGASSLVLLVVYAGARRSGATRALPFRLRSIRALTVACVGAGLAAFWIVPFAANLDYTNDMGWEHTSTFVAGLFPAAVKTQLSDAPRTGVATLTAAILLALFGALVSMVTLARKGVDAARRDEARCGVLVFGMMLIGAAAFRFTPQFRLWNERALPFYYLSAYLLAGFGLVALGRLARQRASQAGWLGVTALTALWSIGAPLRVLPGFVAIPKWSNGSLSVQRADASEDVSSIDDWPAYNYNGYERGEQYGEFKALVDMMDRVGKSNGCGRAMWEYEDELDRYGTSMGPMLLPHYTKGCIGSMEGLYFESSATTPYHFVNASLLGAKASDPQSDLTYPGLDMGRGIANLQKFGVRYYMAFSPSARAAAQAHPDLRSIARSPYTRECSDKEVEEKLTCPIRWEWEVFEVARAEIVQGLDYEPVVVTGIGQSQTTGWLDVAMAQYMEPAKFPTPFAADGPGEWPRVGASIKKEKGDTTYGNGVAVESATLRVLPRVTVTNIVETQNSIRFAVDRPGTPVVVKSSYFPSWKASGAKGPWRLAPNLMVVIPTSNSVRLDFARTGADWLGMGLSGLAVAALGLLFVRRPSRQLATLATRASEPSIADGPTVTEPIVTEPIVTEPRIPTGM